MFYEVIQYRRDYYRLFVMIITYFVMNHPRGFAFVFHKSLVLIKCLVNATKKNISIHIIDQTSLRWAIFASNSIYTIRRRHENSYQLQIFIFHIKKKNAMNHVLLKNNSLKFDVMCSIYNYFVILNNFVFINGPISRYFNRHILGICNFES